MSGAAANPTPSPDGAGAPPTGSPRPPRWLRRGSLRKRLVLVGCFVGIVHEPAWAAGGVLITLGSGLHLWSKGVLEQNVRLTTGGPYRFTRNPFYLANGLIDLGLCLLIGRVWVALVYAPLWVWVYRETVLREEARLARCFGEDFARYRERVPRFWPTLDPLPSAEARGRFRWSNPSLARGSEYARLLGVGLSAGLLRAASVVRREGLALLEPAHRFELAAMALLVVAWLAKLLLARVLRRRRRPAVAGETGS